MQYLATVHCSILTIQLTIQEPEKGVTQRQRQGRSSSISGTRMAVLQQQQEQVAQAAEQKLAAFQAAKEQRQARSTKAPGGRTARSARLAIKGQPTASKLLPHQVSEACCSECIAWQMCLLHSG